MSKINRFVILQVICAAALCVITACPKVKSASADTSTPNAESQPTKSVEPELKRIVEVPTPTPTPQASPAPKLDPVSKPVVTPKPTPTPVDEGTGQIKTFEVRLPVTVTQGKKELVAGLGRGDFIVLEDGVPQEVTFFSDEKNNPAVYVGVLMDTSPSTAGKMGFSKEAAKNFIYSI